MSRLHFLTGINKVNCGEVEPLADVLMRWNEQDEDDFDDKDHKLGIVVFFIGLTVALIILTWIGWVLVS